MRNFQHQILYIKQKFSDKLNFFDRLFLGGGNYPPYHIARRQWLRQPYVSTVQIRVESGPEVYI